MNKTEEKKEKKERKRFFKFKAPGKELFWAWIIYQCVKGTITTTFIWVPLIYFWWTH